MLDHEHRFLDEITRIGDTLRGIRHSIDSCRSDPWATKHDLQDLKERIMSALGEYAGKINTHLDKLDTAYEGIQADFDFFKDTILKLQNNPGPISTEDQALLDGAESRLAGTEAKFEALAKLTPPTPPAG